MRALVLAAAIATAACARPRPVQTCPAPAAFSAADRAAVAALLASQQDAWNRGDLDGFMAGYLRSPDLVFTAAAQIRKGWDETFQKYRARYGTRPQTMGKLAFEVLEVQAVGSDGAVVLGRWRLINTDAAGSGVFSVVLARTAEGWRIVHDHTSSDPPA
jgi:uncharacterized protein (TIGR02246 family)